jgi:hypothetical protein
MVASKEMVKFPDEPASLDQVELPEKLSKVDLATLCAHDGLLLCDTCHQVLNDAMSSLGVSLYSPLFSSSLYFSLFC